MAVGSLGGQDGRHGAAVHDGALRHHDLRVVQLGTQQLGEREVAHRGVVGPRVTRGGVYAPHGSSMAQKTSIGFCPTMTTSSLPRQETPDGGLTSSSRPGLGAIATLPHPWRSPRKEPSRWDTRRPEWMPCLTMPRPTPGQTIGSAAKSEVPLRLSGWAHGGPARVRAPKRPSGLRGCAQIQLMCCRR